MVFTEVSLCPQILTTYSSANTYKLINCVCKLICSVLFLYIVGPCNPDPCQNGGTCTLMVQTSSVCATSGLLELDVKVSQ